MRHNSNCSPGGHVEYGEDPKDACFRGLEFFDIFFDFFFLTKFLWKKTQKKELKEETNLDGKDRILIHVAGNPNRDPREHVISVVLTNFSFFFVTFLVFLKK